MFEFLINTFLIEILFAFNKESRKYYKIDDNNTRHMRIDTEILVVSICICNICKGNSNLDVSKI